MPFTKQEPAIWGAALIREAYDAYQEEFNRITRRAGERFRQRDWQGGQQDMVERLELYTYGVNQVVADIRNNLEEQAGRESVWAEMKLLYARMMTGRDDGELAETFFNSVTRKIFITIGVNPAIEFTAADFKIPAIEDRHCPICQTFVPPENDMPLVEIIRNIVSGYRKTFDFARPEQDAQKVAEAIHAHLATQDAEPPPRIDSVEMIESVFYRDRAAYLIGRIRTGWKIQPLVICLLNEAGGVIVDAVLLKESEVSILFSFTRSYFLVAVDHPTEMVNFLKSIIPLKRVSEIYTSLGFHKHGKAELYRELTRRLAHSTDKFEIARGKKGMVMLVFTIPSFDVVFKIIKDRFEYPKSTTREAVINRYDLVFKHDRAGRLVDAQEFKYLEFDRNRFSEELLAELAQFAGSNAILQEDHVVIRHLYTERRLTPLDLYVEEAGEAAAREATIDYGRAIKELAASNIFPGDLFIKNFGVTRHGRVVFYDYDELCLLTDCRFRKIPRSRGYEDEMSAQPWFHVDENDVFPEEFRTFLKFPPPLNQVFESAHSDLFDVKFWRGMQERQRSGEVVHIFPYKPGRRFLPRSSPQEAAE